MASTAQSEAAIVANLERTGKEYRESLTVLRLAVDLYGRGSGRPRFRTVLRRCARAQRQYRQALKEFSDYYL